MKNDTLHSILDRIKMGDYVEVERRNQSSRPLTSRVEGYALVDTEKGTVGLDILDGDPHIVRTPDREIWGRISEVWVRVNRDHEDSLMFWTED